MEVILYRNNSENNRLNKNIQEIARLDVSLKNDCDMFSPYLFIKGDGSTPFKEMIFDINYCYIPNFGRYYFVNNLILALGNILELDCKVDTLSSFKEQILNLEATITRNENLSNGYIIDSEYRALSYTNIVTKAFPNGLNDNSFILLTVG